jgi:hypothetical protein
MNAANGHENEITDIDSMNSLLRRQLAAVRTYDQALIKFVDPHLLTDLQTIREDHIHAEILLREKVLQMGGEPVDIAEPWVSCAAAFSEDSKVVGPAAALDALRQAEEYSINELEDTLKHENMDIDCKNLIRSNLLPTNRRHVADLNRLMGGNGSID